VVNEVCMVSSPAIGLLHHEQPARTRDTSGDFERVSKTVVLFIALTLVLLALAPALLRPLFPVATCFAGYVIYRRNESYYLSFVLWIYMLAPLLRRLVDWKTSYQDPSMILVAPLLVTLLPVIDLRRRLRMVAPFIRTGALFALSGVVFGAGVGMIKHPSVSEVLLAFMWTAPLVLGLFTASIREPEMLGRVISRTLLWGVLLMSAYAIYQYCVAPPWDTFWLKEVSFRALNPSFGHGKPFEIRVWGTMNAPGPFAIFLSAGVVWLSTLDGVLPVLASLMGYIVLFISLVRTAWIQTIIGLLIFIFGCRTKATIRSITSVLLIVGLVAIVLPNSWQASGVYDRLQTFSSLDSDGSVNDRKDMYNYMAGVISSTPLGAGLEAPLVVHGFTVDSSFVEVFYSLGWLGGLCYFCGIAYLLVRVALSLRSFSREQAAAAAITLACATQAFSGDIVYRQGGIVLWLFFGIWATISPRYAVPT
jgi:hypothetical protein